MRAIALTAALLCAATAVRAEGPAQPQKPALKLRLDDKAPAVPPAPRPAIAKAGCAIAPWAALVGALVVADKLGAHDSTRGELFGWTPQDQFARGGDPFAGHR